MDDRTPDASLPTPEYQSQRERFLQPTHRALSLRLNGAWFRDQALNLRDFLLVSWLDWLTFIIIGATAAGVSGKPSPTSANLSHPRLYYTS